MLNAFFQRLGPGLKRTTGILRHRLKNDLGLRLFLFYLLFIGPVVLVALFFGRSLNLRLETEVKAADLALARSIAQETELNMSNARRAVQELAKYPQVINADIEGMEELFANTISVRPDINLVYRLSAHGFMLYHYPTGPGSTMGADFSFREYFQHAKVTSRSLISSGRISPTTQQPVSTAVMPLWDRRGNFMGVIATNIKLEALSETLEQIIGEYQAEVADDFQAMIIDSSHQIIAHQDSDHLLQPVTDIPEEVINQVLIGRSGNYIGANRSGSELLYSYVPIPSANWGVIISRPTSAAFATAQTFFRGMLSVIAIFIGVGLIYWLNLARQVIRPLETLEQFSQAISQKEELSASQRQGLNKLRNRSDQVGHLTETLLRMEKAIDARLKELSTLFQTSAAVVSTLDHQLVLDRILEQVERLLDVRMSIIVAMDERSGTFRAQASRGLSQQYTANIAIDPQETQSVATRAIQDGLPVQVSDTEADESFPQIRQRARLAGYRAILAVPLKTQYAPRSALMVFHPKPHEFSRQEISLLTNFANHATMAIENAALYARSDMRLQEQTRRLEALVQSLQDGLILQNLAGRVIYANRRISDLTGLELEQVIGSQANVVIGCLVERAQDPEITQKAIHEAQSHPEHSVDLYLSQAGRPIYLRLQMFNVTDLDGIPIGRGQILHDVTADREIDRMKSRLVSTVSHELRTPLAAIKGYATTLLAEDVEWDRQSQRDFLEIILLETDRLSAMVTDLLDLSKIEAGSLVLQRSQSDLRQLIQQAAKRSNPRPEQRMQVTLPEELPLIEVDERLIEAVLRNLIENAARYTGETSPIYVKAELETELLKVSVIDEGPGIPKEQRGHLFDGFHRVEDSLTRSSGGAGLGLAICKGFVEAHGGEIWLEERIRGACFTFTIPLNRAARDVETPPGTQPQLEATPHE
ncbi:MAG: GAF domain-containing protein [Anaerolineales bacterium]|nr:GAF domain-containing protein [Anaerolineales bacterium]